MSFGLDADAMEEFFPGDGVKGPCVYFIAWRLKGHESLVKIGSTDDLTKRLAQLQTASPVKLQAIGALRCHNKRTARYLEQEFHEQYRRWRYRGEWFFLKGLNLKLYAYIRTGVSQIFNDEPERNAILSNWRAALEMESKEAEHESN